VTLLSSDEIGRRRAPSTVPWSAGDAAGGLGSPTCAPVSLSPIFSATSLTRRRMEPGRQSSLPCAACHAKIPHQRSMDSVGTYCRRCSGASVHVLGHLEFYAHIRPSAAVAQRRLPAGQQSPPSVRCFGCEARDWPQVRELRDWLVGPILIRGRPTHPFQFGRTRYGGWEGVVGVKLQRLPSPADVVIRLPLVSRVGRDGERVAPPMPLSSDASIFNFNFPRSPHRRRCNPGLGS
jgi:hypothetical protein